MKKLNSYKTLRLPRKSLIVLLTSLIVSQGALAKTTQTPLEAAYAVKPNVMIQLDNSGSMSANSLLDTDGVNRTRFEVAKNAITDLIEETDHVRYCLAVFQGAVNDGGWQADGGHMTSAMQCTSESKADGTGKLDLLVQEIDNLPVITASTQLAETYYDITRYFQGRAAYFGDIPQFDSPIQNRCQTNSVIVVTDGEPQLDWDRKSRNTPIELSSENGSYGDDSDPTDPLYDQIRIQDRSLPNWDNFPPNGTQHARPFPPLSDGSCGTVAGCDPGASGTSFALFLDDLALFGLQKDLRSDLGSPGDFDVQNLKTHTIGFEIDIQMLEDAAKYGKGEYIEAQSSAALVEALQSAIVTALERQGSGAGATQSDIALDADGRTNLYFSQYDTDNWSGDLLKVQLEEQADHTLKATKIWSSADELDALTDPVASRIIFTPNDNIDGLVDFKSDGQASSMTDTLLAKVRSVNDDGTYRTAKEIVDYIRGDESQNSARNRETLLGDLIHSRATYVKNRNYGYLDDDYRDYVLDNSDRPPMIYVGGNDGMLHAFDEETGAEKFAYVPTSVLKSLEKYRSTSYPENHLYFVDGEFSVVDARVEDGSDLEWATVLGSPLGAGHKGLFLLDITEPKDGTSDLRSDLFKWEIDNKTQNNSVSVFNRMGYIINPPKIVRFKIPEANNKFHEKWVLITGNGIHSKFEDQGKTIYGAASVMVIDLDSGELITELVVDNGFVDQLDTSSGTASYSKFTDGNGLTSVAAVDTEANTYINRLYAADLKGNLWRFNYDDNGTLTSDDAAYIKANLNVAYETSGGIPGPIFTATGGEHPKPYSGSFIQPITAELTVTAAPAASGVRTGEMVFFGTGQFFDFVHLLDDVNDKVQTMYAFWDQGNWDSSSSPKTRADLQEQVIVQNTVDGEQVRTLPSANTIDYATQLGWYMDMPERGERITRKSVGLFEHMAFFTQSPVSGDPCVEGIDGWSMIAKKDTATPIAVTLAAGDGSTTSDLGRKHTGDSIHDPIFVELSDGQFVAPVVIDAAGETPTVEHTVQIQKDYSRASWKRLEL